MSRGYRATVREAAVLSVLGTMLVSSGAPATAAVYHPTEARAAARPDHLSAAEAQALNDLLERSGLRVKLEILSASVRVQLQRGRLRDQDRVTIDRIASGRFDAGALYARIQLEFERNLDSVPLAPALSWYDSPLGKRITELELVALVLDGGRDAVADFEKDRPSPRRLGLIERLDAGGGASETTVDVIMAIVRSLTRAFQPALPAVAGLSPRELDDQLALARNRTLPQIRRVGLLSMLGAYRSLSDPELDEYLRFVESEEGRWYMRLMNSALLAAVDVAARATAAELVIAVPHLGDDLR
jgi:hypothetical protein